MRFVSHDQPIPTYLVVCGEEILFRANDEGEAFAYRNGLNDAEAPVVETYGLDDEAE